MWRQRSFSPRLSIFALLTQAEKRPRLFLWLRVSCGETLIGNNHLTIVFTRQIPSASVWTMPPARGVWTAEEHQLFLEALRFYPKGPWSALADHVGSRSPRQVQTHAQKYYEKIRRHARGLLRNRTTASAREHRVDEAIYNSVSTVTNGSAKCKRRKDRSRKETTPPCLARLSGAPPREVPRARVQSPREEETQLVPLNYDALTIVQEAEFHATFSLLEALPLDQECENVSTHVPFPRMNEQVAIV